MERDRESTFGQEGTAELIGEAIGDVGDDTVALDDALEDGGKKAWTEVFVGGLPPSADESTVNTAFSAVGEVLSVRLNRRKKSGECKGFGFIRYADQATAERACAEVKEACGKPVGVHISRARSIEQAAEEQQNALLEDGDPDTAINKLLKLIRNHSDKRAAVAAALKAVLAVPSKPKSSSPDRAERGDGEGSSGGDEAETRSKEDASLPDPNTFLEGFPRCKRLVDTFRANPNTHNKTPLAILHEYATRLSLELTYDENADSNLGPFTVDARLTSVGGSVLYATGDGRGRGKKDAKQVAAAAVLEMLLANVPESDFLQPGKGKFLKLRVNPRTAQPLAGRGLVAGRGAMLRGGRNGGRWPLGRAGGRGVEYSGSLGNYAVGGTTGGFDLNQGFAPSVNQEVDVYGLPVNAPANQNKVRSYLASQGGDVDILRNLRGNSLDTLSSVQRQLAGLPPQDAPLGMYGNSRSFDNSGFTYEYLQEQEQAALLRQRAYAGSMATVPEGQLQMQMLGMNPQGLPLSPQGLQTLSPQQQQQNNLPVTMLQHKLSPGQQQFPQF